jgi:quinol monooxygenase YgiN
LIDFLRLSTAAAVMPKLAVHVSLKIKPEKLDAFKQLLPEAQALSRAEPGTETYICASASYLHNRTAC